jgi:YfiR/HmsC-like
MALLMGERLRRAGWLAVVVAIGGFSGAAAEGRLVDEYQVKAAFLYNFAKFVEWPPQAFRDASVPIVICVLGQNPFGRSLEEAVDGKIVEDRRLVVRQFADVRQVSGCHILFVSSSERKSLRVILGDLKDSGVLTVGETDGFTAEGGVISLQLEGDRVRFEINLEAAARQKLRISSKLLSLARIVKK